MRQLRPPIYAEAVQAWQMAPPDQRDSHLIGGASLAEAQDWAKGKRLSDADQEFLQASREAGGRHGPLSPRAGLGLLQAARAWALLAGRDHVTPADVQAVFPAVAEHRLDGGQPGASVRGFSQDLLETVDAIR